MKQKIELDDNLEDIDKTNFQLNIKTNYKILENKLK